MGPTCSRNLLKSNRNWLTVVLLGLSGAGKTTIFHQLMGTKQSEKAAQQLQEDKNGTPQRFVVGLTGVDDMKFEIWEILLPSMARGLWRFFYAINGKCALAFVVDATDPDSLADAARELGTVLENPEASFRHVLIFANKQHEKQAISMGDLRAALCLDRYSSRVFHIEPCCAVTGQGLREGLRWLAEHNCIGGHIEMPYEKRPSTRNGAEKDLEKIDEEQAEDDELLSESGHGDRRSKCGSQHDSDVML